MSATVQIRPDRGGAIPRDGYVGWCPVCQDGIRGSLAVAEAWAAAHNTKEHHDGAGNSPQAGEADQ